MSDYVFPPSIAALPVQGGGRFPVRRVWCVGRNYAAHAREMGGAPEREAPFFFAKPADAAVHADAVPYPPATADLHHEVELVVALGGSGADVAPKAALDLVFGYGVGIDLTRRDLQAEAKKAGRPWAMAKGFDASAPCSAIVPVAACGHPAAGRISLDVDGQRRQEGDLAEMVWSVPEILGHLSRLVALAPGDVIFTGTPAGVGPVARGQRLSAEIAGVARLDVRVE